MEFNSDKITALLYKAIDILLIRNPERTAYGIVLGVFFIGLKEAIVEFTEGKVKNALNSINLVSTFCLGVVLVRVDIFFKRETLDKEVIVKLNTLKTAINVANLPENEKRQLYREFIERMYRDVEFKGDTMNIESEKVK